MNSINRYTGAQRRAAVLMDDLTRQFRTAIFAHLARFFIKGAALLMNSINRYAGAHRLIFRGILQAGIALRTGARLLSAHIAYSSIRLSPDIADHSVGIQADRQHQRKCQCRDSPESILSSQFVCLLSQPGAFSLAVTVSPPPAGVPVTVKLWIVGAAPVTKKRYLWDA